MASRISYRITQRSTASPEVLYDLLLDAAGWPRWAPLVGSAHMEGPPVVGGVRVVGSRGVTVREQITELEPGRRHGYVIVGDRPARDYRALVTFEPSGAGTDITWVGSFEPNPPVVGHAYGLFVRWYVARLAAALARTAEGR